MVFAVALIVTILSIGMTGSIAAAGQLSASKLAAPMVLAQEADRVEWGEQLAACVSDRRSLLALFLVDESGSLQQTDSEAERVPAVQVGVSGLNDFVGGVDAQGGDPVDLQVSVVGFSSLVTERIPWSSAEDVLASPELAAMSARNDGIETDYVNALLGAVEAFELRRADVVRDTGIDPCKVMFWFTDGRFEIAKRSEALRDRGVPFDEEKVWAPNFDLTESAEGVVELGRAAICAGTPTITPGIADRLRDAGVISITLALTTQIDAFDRDFLVAIANNPPGNRCGSAAAIGEPIEGDDMVEITCSLATPSDGTKLHDGCAEEPFDPDIMIPIAGDPGMDRATVVVASTVDLDRLELLTPSGLGIELVDGLDRTVSGAAVRSRVTANRIVVASIDFEPDSQQWIGDWELVATAAGVADGEASTQVTYWGDYEPSFELASEPLRQGDSGELLVSIETSAGVSVDAATFADFEVQVVPTAGTVTFGPVQRQASQFVATIDTRSASIGDIEAEISVRATTQSGIELDQVTRRGRFEIGSPPGYPTVVSGPLELGTHVGDGQVQFSIEVEGAPDNETCVWFNSVVPDESVARIPAKFTAEFNSPSTGEECVTIQPNERALLEGAIGVSDAVRSGYSGQVGVALRARDDLPVLEDYTPIRFFLEKPIVVGTRNWIFLLAMAAGIATPVLFTAATNWISSRFRADSNVKHLPLDVVVGAKGVMMCVDDQLIPLEARKSDTILVDPIKGRRFSLDGFDFSPRHTANPFSAPQGQVSAPGAVVFSGTAGNARTGHAPTRFTVANQWFASVPEPEEAASATAKRFTAEGLAARLLFIVPFDDAARTTNGSDGSDSELDKLATAVTTDLPSKIQAWIETLPEAPAKPEDPSEPGLAGPRDGPPPASPDNRHISSAPDQPSVQRKGDPWA